MTSREQAILSDLRIIAAMVARTDAMLPKDKRCPPSQRRNEYLMACWLLGWVQSAPPAVQAKFPDLLAWLRNMLPKLRTHFQQGEAQ